LRGALRVRLPTGLTLRFLHMYVLGEPTDVRKTSNFVKLEKALFSKHIHVQIV